MTLPPWTATLCTVYAATGSLLEAMRVVDIRPSEFYAILECNPEFAQRIAEARRQAHRTAARIMLSEAVGRRNQDLVPQFVDAALGEGDLSDRDFLYVMQSTVRRIREALA